MTGGRLTRSVFNQQWTSALTRTAPQPTHLPLSVPFKIEFVWEVIKPLSCLLRSLLVVMLVNSGARADMPIKYLIGEERRDSFQRSACLIRANRLPSAMSTILKQTSAE